MRPQSFAESAASFERATQLDPNYAAAWAQLGLSIGSTTWIILPEDVPAIMERAYSFVVRAVELDPASALANTLLANTLYFRRDWIGADKAYAKALLLLTDRFNVNHRANMLMRAGRSAMARQLYDMAESLEPRGGLPAFFREYVSLAQLNFTEAKEVTEWNRESPLQTFFGLEIALNEDDPEEIKTAIRSLPKTNISTDALYNPVLSVFDTPEMVLSALRAIYSDEGTQWPSKLHDIALLAAYFDDPQFALQVKAEEVRNTPVRQGALWYPVMSEVRQLPEFKELVTDINLVAYWRAYGFADNCKPLGDDDFTCI
jgi:tetratricopeptide (TPR) repeat protein